MKVGGKRILIIPSELAYGKRGSGKIKPDSRLKFSVELRSVAKLEISEVNAGTGEKLKDGDKFQFHYKVYSQKDTSKVIIDTKSVLKVGDKKNNPVFLKLMENASIGTKRSAVIPGKQTNIIEFEVLSIVKPVKMWDLKDPTSKTTKSGLQYIIVEQGTGEKVLANKMIKVHYSGFLEDGTQFDSSVERGTPIEFEVGIKRVIAGWDEGLQLLNVGTKARFVIPANLAYGPKGSGPIPPNATIIFDVEVMGLSDKKAAPKR